MLNMNIHNKIKSVKNVKHQISLLISLTASLRQSQAGDVKGEAVQTPAEGPKLPDASTGV